MNFYLLVLTFAIIFVCVGYKKTQGDGVVIYKQKTMHKTAIE